MNDDKNDSTDNTIVLDIGDYGAAQPSYATYSLDGTDTITIDPSLYTVNSSITAPSTITWSQNYGTTYTGTGIWGNTDANVKIDTDGINIKEGGDIKIAGKSLSDAIEKIEERLGILNPNPELEDRWEQLKELRKQYIKLEKDLLEKEKLMKILKEK